MKKLLRLIVMISVAASLVACNSSDTPYGMVDNYAEVQGYTFEVTEYDIYNNAIIIYIYGASAVISSENGHFTRVGNSFTPTDGSCLTVDVNLKDGYTLEENIHGTFNKVPINMLFAETKLEIVYGLSFSALQPWEYYFPDEYESFSATQTYRNSGVWGMYAHWSDTICTNSLVELDLDQFGAYILIGGLQLTIEAYKEYLPDL